MVDETRRKLLGSAAAASAASLSGCLADIVLKEEDRERRFGDRTGKKTKDVSGSVEVLDGVDDHEFEDWVDEAEQRRQDYHNHHDLFDEVMDELEATPYTTEFSDYQVERHQGGRGVMVTDDVVLATTENQTVRREVDGDQRTYVVADGVDAAQTGFPTLEGFLEDEEVPGMVDLGSLKTYLNDFGQLAPFVPETKYRQPNFAEHIIDEFVDQKKDIDRYIDKYENILTGGPVRLDNISIDAKGLAQVIDDTIDLRNDIRGADRQEVGKDKYKDHKDKYVKLSEAKKLLEGDHSYAGVEDTLQMTDDLYTDVARELGALAVLSEVYEVAIEEMEKGGETYDEGKYGEDGRPKHDKKDKPKTPEVPDKDKDHKHPKDDKVTEPVYEKNCAKIKNWDLYEMEEDLSYNELCDLMEPVLRDVYGKGHEVKDFFDDSFDNGETGIIFLHYEENEASGEIRNAKIGYRMINEDGVSVPSGDGQSRFGPPVYGPYKIDGGLADDVLDHVTVDMECRNY